MLGKSLVVPALLAVLAAGAGCPSAVGTGPVVPEPAEPGPAPEAAPEPEPIPPPAPVDPALVAVWDAAAPEPVDPIVVDGIRGILWHAVVDGTEQPGLWAFFSDDVVSYYDGCNWSSAAVSYQRGSRLDVTQESSTLRLCPDRRGGPSLRLDGSWRFAVDGNRAVLTPQGGQDAGDDERVEVVLETPQLYGVGTLAGSWRLETTSNAGWNESMASTATTVTLTIDSGRYEASAGDDEGTWVSSSGYLGRTADCLALQEDGDMYDQRANPAACAALEALAPAPEYRLEGDRLFLRNGDTILLFVRSAPFRSS